MHHRMNDDDFGDVNDDDDDDDDDDDCRVIWVSHHYDWAGSGYRDQN